jgi:hypothetical protein
MVEYGKPDLIELGDATRVIQGSKTQPPEIQPTDLAVHDCEIQD